MIKSTFIYGLKDPNTEQIRYIGKTSHPEKRLKHHISVRYNNHKSNWIQSLLKNNEKPILEIIDEVPISNWEFWEKHYIRLFKSLGAELVNSTEGGRGGEDDRKLRKDTIEKMRLAQLGKKHTEESKKKMSESAKRKAPISEKTREIHRKNSTGRKRSLSAIEKTASANRGRKNTQETKDIIRKKLEGRKVPSDVLIRRAKAQMKPIIQLDFSGNVVKEWNSVKDASREINPSNHGLSTCLKGKRKSWAGFKWEYK